MIRYILRLCYDIPQFFVLRNRYVEIKYDFLCIVKNLKEKIQQKKESFQQKYLPMRLPRLIIPP